MSKTIDSSKVERQPSFGDGSLRKRRLLTVVVNEKNVLHDLIISD